MDLCPTSQVLGLHRLESKLVGCDDFHLLGFVLIIIFFEYNEIPAGDDVPSAPFCPSGLSK